MPYRRVFALPRGVKKSPSDRIYETSAVKSSVNAPALADAPPRPIKQPEHGRPEKRILDPHPTPPPPPKVPFSSFFPLKLEMYFPGLQGLWSSFDQQDVGKQCARAQTSHISSVGCFVCFTNMRLDWLGCCIVGGVLGNNARERAQTSHIYISSS